jgi:Flp pilus assembly protein TadB
MELVACGLRAGLSVADALACAAAVAGRAGATQRDALDRSGPPPAGPGRWRHRRNRRAIGAPTSAYLDQVVSRLRLGACAAEAWARPPPDLVSLASALQLAELSGAPAAAVVSRAATDLRASQRERTELAAARLGVRLVLPLGLAVLPGFVLLAVAPIVLGLATSVLQSAG